MAVPGISTQAPLPGILDLSSRHVAGNNTSAYHHDKGGVVNSVPNITSTMYPGNINRNITPVGDTRHVNPILERYILTDQMTGSPFQRSKTILLTSQLRTQIKQ